MQGNLIDEAETESLFHEIRTKFITLYLVGCGDPTHRCARAARSFRKICSTDRSGELRSPAFEVCIGVTEPVFLLICVAFYPDKSLPRCHVTIHYIYKPFYIAVM